MLGDLKSYHRHYFFINASKICTNLEVQVWRPSWIVRDPQPQSLNNVTDTSFFTCIIFTDTLLYARLVLKECKSTVVKRKFFMPKFFLDHPGVKSEVIVSVMGNGE